ncbi:MAG: hypothetical protein IJB79_04730 [Candidatus Gastranaerophilales bacterium]|nr:hypothetical protein [Candidatus Gastranaerophilales bacterium]
MDISSLGAYAGNLNFKGATDVAMKGAKKLIQDLPALKLKNPMEVPFGEFSQVLEENEALTKAYRAQLDAICFDENGNLAPEIAKFLDETTFEITTGGSKGVPIETTIKDYLRQSIHTPEVAQGTLFHGTLNPRNIDNIIENGFDVSKINSGRTKLGPGFYFSGDYGAAMNYGCVLQADAKGIVAGADNAFYENVANSKTCKQVGDLIGLTPEVCDDPETCYSYPAKLINEYSRKFIVEKLGIDALRGWGGNSTADNCVCVLNPNILTNIRRA